MVCPFPGVAFLYTRYSYFLNNILLQSSVSSLYQRHWHPPYPFIAFCTTYKYKRFGFHKAEYQSFYLYKNCLRIFYFSLVCYNNRVTILKYVVVIWPASSARIGGGCAGGRSSSTILKYFDSSPLIIFYSI